MPTTTMTVGGLFPCEVWGNYFASGSNHAGEIAGLAAAGRHVGVSVSELDKAGAAEAALLALRGGPTLVFVDSGAFGEVDARLQVRRPITDAEWASRLDAYDRLAPLGTQLYVVAPDRVGCQETTLARLERYADRMRALRAQGVNVIVPLQRGALSQAAFDERCRAVLGFADFIRGVPAKKGATTDAGLAELCEALWADAAVPKPVRMHLLGIGPQSPRYESMASTILLALPGTWPIPVPGLTAAPTLTCDSVRIMALVGTTNGPGGGPRAITAERARVLEDARAAGEDLGVAEVKRRTIEAVFERENDELLEATDRLLQPQPQLDLFREE